MATTIIRQQQQATPTRWQSAVERAISEGVQVRQLAGSGAWIATSGSDAATAYEIEVTGEVAHGCSCLAGINGDPVCKHRAAFYFALGLLDPEPEPPAPALAPCGYCFGRGWETVIGKSGAAYRFDCQVCDGAGSVPVEDGDNEPSSPAATHSPFVPAPTVCARCRGAGTVTMNVATAMDIYPVAVMCRACCGAGVIEEPSITVAA
ncbi:MAG: hypothetical protein M3464_11995 [Chloroflexota bacterium]|nr:hypothetical protein [Chloroflexota bacterium]